MGDRANSPLLARLLHRQIGSYSDGAPVRFIAALLQVIVLVVGVAAIARYGSFASLADPALWAFVVCSWIALSLRVRMSAGGTYSVSDVFEILAVIALPVSGAVTFIGVVTMIEIISGQSRTWNRIDRASNTVASTGLMVAVVLAAEHMTVGGVWYIPVSLAAGFLAYQLHSAVLFPIMWAVSTDTPMFWDAWKGHAYSLALRVTIMSYPIGLVTAYSMDVYGWWLMLPLPITYLMISQLSRSDVELASANEQLEAVTSMVGSDPLTGLANRERYFEIVTGSLMEAHREQLAAAAFMWDLDDFKQLNDTRGHSAGDIGLVTAASVLREIAERRGLVVARYGGEEFVGYMGGADRTGALDIAEEVRRGIERSCEELGITVSCGVALLLPGEFLATSNGIRPARRSHTTETDTAQVVAKSYLRASDTLVALLERADGAMYAAKRAGKNRTELWTPDVAQRRAA